MLAGGLRLIVQRFNTDGTEKGLEGTESFGRGGNCDLGCVQIEERSLAALGMTPTSRCV